MNYSNNDLSQVIKVLIVTQNIPPVVCGVGDYVTSFVKELYRQNSNLRFAFLTCKPSLASEKYVVNDSRPHIYEISEIFEVAPQYWTIWHLPQLLKTVRKSGASIIHIHFNAYGFYYAGVGFAVTLFVFLLRIMGFKVIITFHELYIRWKVNPKQFLVACYQRFSTISLALAANELIVTTGLRARALKNYFFWHPWKRSKIICVPVGSNFSGSKSSISVASEIKSKWGISEKSLILSSFGNLGQLEAFDWLVSALLETQKVEPESILVLIGCLESKLPVNHLLRNRRDVICTGYCSSLEVQELLKITDIYLLPIEDGVSSRRTSLMAGLDYGLPIVSTIGSTSEVDFINDLPVLLCELKNKEEFAGLTAILASDKSKRVELGREAETFFQQKFTWEKIVSQQIHLFLEGK